MQPYAEALVHGGDCAILGHLSEKWGQVQFLPKEGCPHEKHPLPTATLEIGWLRLNDRRWKLRVADGQTVAFKKDACAASL